MQGAPDRSGPLVDGFGQLLQERASGRVDDPVHGVESERVHMELLEPLQRVLDEVTANLVTAGPVEIKGPSPRRSIPVREVRAEAVHHASLRTDVVVYDVEDDGH